MAENALIKIIVLIWLGVCAWQDWRVGEVSNWLTVPPMPAALVYAVSGGGNAWMWMAAAGLGSFVLFSLGAMGGADAKILITLAGVWPAAMLGSLLVQGVWGVVVLIRQGRGAKFRAIPAYALGSLLSILL